VTCEGPGRNSTLPIAGTGTEPSGRWGLKLVHRRVGYGMCGLAAAATARILRIITGSIGTFGSLAETMTGETAAKA
jgi:hypothetical protein